MTNNHSNDWNFDHTRWIDNISEFCDHSRNFLHELKETGIVLLAQGITRLVKEALFFFSRATRLDYICGGISAFFGFLATSVALAGAGLFGYQVLLFLKQGDWTPFPLLMAFDAIFKNTALQEWLLHPGSWLGLQEMVSWILQETPLTLALIVPGTLAAVLIAGFMATAVAIRYYRFKNLEKSS